MSHEWPQESVDTLRRLIDEGCTAAAIGAALGITRNAVIGKIGRMGLKLARSTGPKQKGPPKPKRVPTPVHARPVRLKLNANLPGVYTGPTPVQAAPRYDPASKRDIQMPGRPLSSLGAFQCRYEVNNAGIGDEHLFCGKRTDGGSWCPWHRQIVYQPSSKREFVGLAKIAA